MATFHRSETLVGPTATRPVQDPLAVLLLNNRLYMGLLHFSELSVVPGFTREWGWVFGKGQRNSDKRYKTVLKRYHNGKIS